MLRYNYTRAAKSAGFCKKRAGFYIARQFFNSSASKWPNHVLAKLFSAKLKRILVAHHLTLQSRIPEALPNPTGTMNTAIHGDDVSGISSVTPRRPASSNSCDYQLQRKRKTQIIRRLESDSSEESDEECDVESRNSAADAPDGDGDLKEIKGLLLTLCKKVARNEKTLKELQNMQHDRSVVAWMFVTCTIFTTSGLLLLCYILNWSVTVVLYVNSFRETPSSSASESTPKRCKVEMLG